MTMKAIRLKWRCQYEKTRATVEKTATERPKLVRNSRYARGIVTILRIAIERRRVKIESPDSLKINAVK